MRNLWMMEELGLAFEHRSVEWDDPWLKGLDYLTLNPAGSIPLLIDNDFALAESLAINLHLARNYGGGRLYLSEAHEAALVLRWSLWAQSHVEPWVQRDETVLRHVTSSARMELLCMALATLERALMDRVWLVGEMFSVADANVAGILSPSRVALFDLTPWPAVTAWLARCYGRPAAVRAREKYAS